MTRILLVRHGQTEWNRHEVFRGSADIPLNETGLRQAGALGRRLTGERPSAIYCSPLSRALVTAEVLGGPGGLHPQTVDGLTDMSYGAWEGQQHSQVKERHPDLYARWMAEPHLVRPPGGEMLEEVRRRAIAALDTIAADSPKTAVVVVSHRVVNKLLLCVALGIGDEGFWRIRQDTCCLNILERDADRTSVVLLNDTCHLSGLEQDASDF
ncbi:MAG: histidine phosphatase family protein [bacterium]|nr:histidine phosphatase family protein [bacterium]